jgi:hypothetical protein
MTALEDERRLDEDGSDGLVEIDGEPFYRVTASTAWHRS